jgi:hypothetical protein
MHTLKILMKLLAIGFHYDKMFEKYNERQSLECLVMLMSRCRRLYNAIEYLNTIFKLIVKRMFNKG